MKITYRKAGVDIDKAEQFLKAIRHFIRPSLSHMEAFGSLFDLEKALKKYKKPVLVSSSDGVGTKLKIAQQLQVHNTVGVDLVAMNTNDIVCLGAKPLFFLDYIACGSLKPLVLTRVVRGIAKGLRQSECLLLGGETAEMPGMYRKGEYDLAGFCVGIADKDKIIDGKKIKPGDIVIGIASSGLHSNGFSLVRKIFSRKEIKKYSKQLLKPTRIYVKPVLALLEARCYTLSAIKGIAHNTGGAFYTKITKILPRGLAFRIDKDSWPVPKIFRIIQKKSGLKDKEMYSTFNMGIGMVIVVGNRYATHTVNFLKSKGYKSFVIGKVVRSRAKKTILV
ncbi:MAG: phosphoribosylformylglycinamidine cyclo-ligase [Candidatus Omnitrophica bacterium]|nr:phosphoribosylformylglycinamidine cyclo-ligase [Candidatus Omnitrophota bacterium]